MECLQGRRNVCTKRDHSGFGKLNLLPKRMEIERLNAGSCRPALQSSFVLVVRNTG